MKRKPLGKLICRNIFSIFFLLIWGAQSNAQSLILDSLENALLLHPQEDTTQIKLMSSIVHETLMTDTVRALALIEDIEVLSDQLNFQGGKVDAIFLRGQIALRQNHVETALNHSFRAKELAQSMGDLHRTAKVLNGIGIIYSYQNKTDSAVQNYEEAAAIFHKIGEKRGAAGILSNVGIELSRQGMYSEAIANYTKAMAMETALNDHKGVAKSYLEIAKAYDKQGNYPKAFKYGNEALSRFEQLELEGYEASTLLLLGGMYYKQEKNEKAKAYIVQALEISVKNKKNKDIAECRYGLGHVYYGQKKYTEALEHFRLGLEYYEASHDKKSVAKSYIAIGLVYLDLNLEKQALKNCQMALEIHEETGSRIGKLNAKFSIARIYVALGNYQKALEYALESQEIAGDLHWTVHEKEAADLLSTIYSELGDYKNAFASHQQFKILSDSLLNDETKERMTELEYEYKFKLELEEGKNRELKLSKQVVSTSYDLRKSNRNLLLSIIAFLSAILVLGSINLFLRRNNFRTKTQNIATEQRLLRTQMTPHFIFNALSVLQGMILAQEEKKSISYLSKFSKLLRLTLENSRDQMVGLDRELAAVDAYLKLQNLEVEAPYNYTLCTKGDLDPTTLLVPPMLIQPFIENAIEHGFRGKKNERKIEVDLSFKAAVLTCIIKDNGIGIEVQKESSNPQKRSMSTTITAERLKYLSKRSKTKGSVTIEDRKKDQEQGTIVTLEIPYQFA